MKVKKLKNKLITLPPAIEFTLFMIKEELKANKLFSTLNQVGFDGSYYHSDYSTVILESVGFKEESNEVLDFYFGLVRAYCKKVEDDDAKTTKQAFKFYIDLVIEKRKRLG
jgi:hypothetical protein